jgi:PAS domain S-box-containing protein
MPEMITIPKAQLDSLDERVKKLAVDKSYLQLIIRLMNRMSAVPGLDNTIENILRNIVDVIGGTNVILYYLIDDDIYYADVYGERKKLAGVTDSQVKKVMETRESVEFEHEFSDTQMMTTEFSKAYTWIVPLRVGAELVGVFKMESLNIAIRDLYQQLPAFFTYVALVLKNEILGYTRLTQAYARLEQEVVVRRQVDEELRQTNEALELRVAERTFELRNANEQLRENEKQIKLLLGKSEQSRRALLGIIEDEKQAEAALQRERALLSRIMETSPVGITMVSRDGQVTFANPQTEKVLGLTKDTITQRAYNAPDWRITDYEGNPFPDDQLPFQRVMSTQQPVHDVQHAIVWPDGRRVLLSINGAPLLDEAGKIESVVCTIEDVTEQRIARHQQL